MKLKVLYRLHDKWVAKRLERMAPVALGAMETVLSVLKGRVQVEYLHGPYPQRLSFQTGGPTSGNLKDNIQVATYREGDGIIGIVGVRQLPGMVRYGKLLMNMNIGKE